MSGTQKKRVRKRYRVAVRMDAQRKRKIRGSDREMSERDAKGTREGGIKRGRERGLVLIHGANRE